MKLIIITLENIIDGEAVVINELFRNGLETLHLRKPLSELKDISSLIGQIDSVYHNRIVLHNHYQLTDSFNLKGVHLNRRNPEPPKNEVTSISRSCHSFECLSTYPDYDYLFLSPIFNSVSKSGYGKGFTHEQLRDAKNLGLIDGSVYALGGITVESIPQVAEYGFGGVAVLGALWENWEHDKNQIALIERFRNFKDACRRK